MWFALVAGLLIVLAAALAWRAPGPKTRFACAGLAVVAALLLVPPWRNARDATASTVSKREICGQVADELRSFPTYLTSGSLDPRQNLDAEWRGYTRMATRMMTYCGAPEESCDAQLPALISLRVEHFEARIKIVAQAIEEGHPCPPAAK